MYDGDGGIFLWSGYTLLALNPLQRGCRDGVERLLQDGPQDGLVTAISDGQIVRVPGGPGVVDGHPILLGGGLDYSPDVSEGIGLALLEQGQPLFKTVH